MKVRLRLYGGLKAVVGSREIELELPEGAELRRLPPLLRSRCGEGLFRLLGEQEPFGHLRVLINGHDHFTLQGQETVLADGDTVTFIPLIVGG
jgi:molybdopterin converting factor small subunit